MVLLFVAGVMNPFWMVGLAVFVLVEKAAPYGDLIGRIAGGTLILAGIALIAG
jgi:predicted metal-binding membrane protein